MRGGQHGKASLPTTRTPTGYLCPQPHVTMVEVKFYDGRGQVPSSITDTTRRLPPEDRSVVGRSLPPRTKFEK